MDKTKKNCIVMKLTSMIIRRLQLTFFSSNMPKAYLGGEKRRKNLSHRKFLKNLYYFYIFILLDYFQIKDKGRKKSLKFPPKKNPGYAFVICALMPFDPLLRKSDLLTISLLIFFVSGNLSSLKALQNHL